MIPYEELAYGFTYGAATVTRTASNEDRGWVVLTVKTPKEILHIRVTKTGKVNVTGPKPVK